jgi:catechol 2,3-dioxygenase-like lactoylglutathione lyase family enzyme
MIRGIEHTAITSPQPKTLAAWYVDTLGFTVCYESASTMMVRAQNGYVLEITGSEGERPPQTLKTPGLRHLALLVDDFDAVCQTLRAKHVNFVSEPAESKGNRVVFFTDPEGNYLHLLQRAQPLA